VKNNDIEALLQSTASIRKDTSPMKYVAIAAILSTAFSYSCIFSTYFLLTSPIECKRIEDETREYYSHTISKSIALGGFAALAGLAQLISPLIGLVSDCYIPNTEYGTLKSLGKRMPYLILGEILIVLGLFGQMWASSPIHPMPFTKEGNNKEVALVGAWFQYAIFFLLSMFGINIVYTIMIALIPDLVPKSQTGVANGTLALLLVFGSLFGFCYFHLLSQQNVQSMYKMYITVSIATTILTCAFVEREKMN